MTVPLPPILTLEGVVPFVPRPDPWSKLETAWAAAVSGARRVVLVSGEAGTGKTRLVAEFARSVHAEGAVVLYGACSEDQTVPYQPFAEALGDLRSADRVETIRLSGDDDADRARLFRAVTADLIRIASGERLLVVLDDLHWSRRPTVEMLTHVIREQTLTNTMIVGTYRSTPLDLGEAMRWALPDLTRLPGVSRVKLDGLDAAGVAEFVAAATGQPVAGGTEPGGDHLGEIVDILVRETDGNAFLLVELWLHLVESGHLERHGGRYVVVRPPTEVTCPDGVRDVVTARLERLEPEARTLLGTAAVIGPAFSPALVATVAGASVGHVLVTLDAAVRSRLIDDDGAGTFRFSHELIRRSVYDGLGAADRRRRHLQIADALDGPASGVTERARHLIAAVPMVSPMTAVDAAVRAAAGAADAVAFDDAVYLLEAALAIADDGARAGLLIPCARAMMRSGDVAGAKARCLEAHELARRAADSELQIAAALAYGDAAWRDTRDSDVAAMLLRDAFRAAGDEPTRILIQTALTRALAIAGEAETASLLGEDALLDARRLNDAELLRAALDALSYTPWTPQTLTRQLAHIREAVETARLDGDPERESLAIGKLLYGEITAGDLTAARATSARGIQLATESGQAIFMALNHQAKALLALGEGRFVDAERHAEAADVLTRNPPGTPSGGYGVQMFSIRREQDRLDEARPVVEAVVRLDQQGSAWRPALAVMYAELGLTAEAAAELSILTTDGLAAVPRDALWLGTLSYLADACRLVGDKTAAAAVYDELVTWRGLVVHVGFLLAAHGAVDRYLGELAAVLGWEREAEIHFDAALRVDAASAMPVWLAHTQLSYARFLAARGRPADAERSAKLLASARATAETVGLPAVSAAIRSTPRQEATPVRDTAGLTERELDVLALLARGRSNRDIASRLHISQHTAANHVRSILMKTACANRTEAATWAVRRHLADA